MFLLVGFAAFLTMVSFAVSTGEIMVKQQQLQDLADATALAGAAALRDGENADQAILNAASISTGEASSAFRSVELPADTVEVGRYNFAKSSFDPLPTANEGVPAVRVAIPISITMNQDGAANPALVMSGFIRDRLGISQLSLFAEAIAVVRPRDIVILQDITGSFLTEFEFARQADLALVDIIAESYGGLGDQIGVVTFGREAYTEFPLTPVVEGLDDLRNFLFSTMEVCTTFSSQHSFGPLSSHRQYDPTDPTDRVGTPLLQVNCQGTGTGPAIAHATTMLENAVARGSDPVIVMVTDGVPCHFQWPLPSSEWVAAGKAAAIEAAIAARELGVRIFVVDLSLPPFGASQSCSADGSAFNLDLASHGFGTTTADPSELASKLVEVANKLTLRLVR
ncbi:MAG: VWA domain-containing protein [Myxococcota bacterium]|nr:VWA domain-containing protein [Myxococcota bacterium]